MHNTYPPCAPAGRSGKFDLADTERRAALLAAHLLPHEVVEVRRRMLAHAADWQALLAQVRLHLAAAPLMRATTTRSMPRCAARSAASRA
ncbi:MAG: hypothetical protein V4754_11965 [Pseudomonadota bacterium]